MGSNSHSQDIIEGSNVYFECNIKVSEVVTLTVNYTRRARRK